MYNPDIIHMSLGTKKWRYKYKLKKLIDDIMQRDIVIVSAASNDGKVSYPAYFKNVIGVKRNNDNETKSIYYKRNFYYAPGNIPQNLYKNDCKSLIGNSFAAAYVTGYIAKVIYYENLKNVNEVNSYLKNKLPIEI